MSEPNDTTERNDADGRTDADQPNEPVSVTDDDTSTAEHPEPIDTPERPAAPIDAKPHPGPHRV